MIDVYSLPYILFCIGFIFKSTTKISIEMGALIFVLVFCNLLMMGK